MKIINCTPFELNINGCKIPPSGKVVSVKEERKLINTVILDGEKIPIYKTFYEDLENFELPDENEILVVSTVAKNVIQQCRFPMRGMVASPGNYSYDKNRNCICVDGLDL